MVYQLNWCLLITVIELVPNDGEIFDATGFVIIIHLHGDCNKWRLRSVQRIIKKKKKTNETNIFIGILINRMKYIHTHFLNN